MSFLIQNTIDKSYINRISQETRILKSSKLDWDIEDVTRFASLLKIQESIATIIEIQEIDGEMLFNLSFLTTQLELSADETKFLPISKLFFMGNAMLEPNRSQDHESLQTGLLFNGFQSSQIRNCSESPISIDEQIIRRLKNELKTMNNVSVIQLSSQQMFRLVRNTDLMTLLDFKEERAEFIKKWCIDGFSLICIIANQAENSLIGNYYSDEELNFLRILSNIFIHLYYSQYWENFRKESKQNTALNWQETKEDDFGIDFLDINNLEGFGVKGSLGQSEYDDGEEQKALGTSEYAESVVGSGIRQSAWGVSERGSIKNSEYGMSERGSIRYSMTGSVYASSEYMQGELSTTATQTKDQDPKPSSSISADENLEALASVSLRLPFNLLNLEALQKIKIATMAYPFAVHKVLAMKKELSGPDSGASDTISQKTESVYDLISEGDHVSESKVFNLAGVRFGRSPQNDFSYPDQLSISGKHAQIVFKDEAYYIRDLGSKTGTFLYISSLKPLVLTQQQIIQLSYEVEIKVVIVKNDMNEGVIKFQFKKPENEPPYRAILKNHNTVRIGKAEKSHIRLLNQSISSYHAQIRYEQGKFLMYDCNTRTGTWLRLSPKGIRSTDRKLSKNDIFRISSKKTFFVEDVTEVIRFESHCPLASMIMWPQ